MRFFEPQRHRDAKKELRVNAVKLSLPFFASLCLCGSFVAVAVAAPAPAPDLPAEKTVKNSPAIKKYYAEALDLYAHEDYRGAIIKWTAILKEDPDQRTAQTMILEGRKLIAIKTRDHRRRAFAFIDAGDYRRALKELQGLLDQDPGDPDLEATQRRLEGLIKLSPRIAPDSRAARAAILGVKGWLALPPDLRLAHNALRYAAEAAPKEKLYERLLALLYEEYPSLTTADAVTPGMKLLEYKHYVALHQIYDGKHHQAILTLNEILMFEPGDLMALKRLGSAYYSLNRMDDAQAAWTAALKIAPRDKTLEHFLAKIKKYKSSAPKR